MIFLSKNNVARLRRIFKNKESAFALFSMFVVIVLATALLSLNNTGHTFLYNVGDIALEDIRVPRDIHYVNENETKRLKERAAAATPLVFDRDTKVLAERLQIIATMFSTVGQTLEQYPPLGTDLSFQLMALKSRLPQYLIYNDSVLLAFLGFGDAAELQRVVSTVVIHIYDNKEENITEAPYDNPLNVENRNISVRLDADEISATIDSLQPVEEIKRKVYGIFRTTAPGFSARTANAATIFISSILKPDTFFNEEETKKRIEKAVNNVKPVMAVLKKGQTILREGDTVTIEALERVQVLNSFAEKSNKSYVVGVFLIQLIFLAVLAFFFIGFRRVLIPNIKFSVIVFSLLGIFMIYTYFMAGSEIVAGAGMAFVLILPIPLVAMIISVLYGITLSLLMSLHAVFFAVLIHGGDFNTVMLAASSALLGTFVNWNVQKRTDFLLGGLYIGVINSLIILSLAFMQELPGNIILRNIQIAFMGGFINAVLALGLFPMYETVFGITTKFKLLELSDLNSDIFRRMLLEAPGTYHHSLIVSNMAEAACRTIRGADPLLARVGAFYHDIGKIEDYGMYIENTVTDPRASKLSPLEYSKLIISHVDKGVAMARKQRLPESVINFIREHHGESTMTFFYHKALEEMSDDKGGQKINRSDFQYKGNKPRSKESAIVMMADAIEAASRSLQEPTSEQLKGLVRKIIYNKLNEGELDDSYISMAELNSVQETFLVILNGIYHTRMEYPETAEVQQLEEKLKAGNANGAEESSGTKSES